MWDLVNSISEVFYDWIKDLRFEPCLDQKPFDILV